MPEYLVTTCAWAGARLSSAAIAAAAIIRMKSSLNEPLLLWRHGRGALTCLSIEPRHTTAVAKAKHPAQAPGVMKTQQIEGRLCRLQIAGRLLAALGHDVERHLLTFGERAHAGALHRADMHEHILAAVGRLDETKALLGVEELHGTCRHQLLLA